MKKIASIVIGVLCLIMCLVIPTAVLEKSSENNIVANAGFFDYGEEYFFKLASVLFIILILLIEFSISQFRHILI